jgi:ferredoxin
VGWSAAVLVVALVLGFDLDGTSPVHAGSTAAYWSRRWPAILKLWGLVGYEIEEHFDLEVDRMACLGCGACVDVCPKGVYKLQQEDGRTRSQIVAAEACVQCTACVKQCPEGAIIATPPVKLFSEV